MGQPLQLSSMRYKNVGVDPSVDPPRDITTDSHSHRHYIKPSACLNTNTSNPRADTWVSPDINHQYVTKNVGVDPWVDPPRDIPTDSHSRWHHAKSFLHPNTKHINLTG
ncbi:hypothetical protein [Gimesia aquarii]|uniref:hypothetical protein n=1 Tax=Gimesia aquarii TaxID=2527964 RepID=UPI0011A5AFD2|nr:hypothetical protein [Gimesia aquarii]